MKRSRIRLTAAGIAVALVLAGCAQGSVSGDDPAEGPANTELDHVTVGVFTSASFAPLELAISNGTFERYGIDLELTTAQGGAALLPAVSTGDVSIAVGNPVSVLTAARQGLDMRVIAGFTYNSPAIDDTTVVVAFPEAGLTSAGDLEGKRVAVNSLGGSAEISIREAAKLEGADHTKITFVEMGFGDMRPQLDNGGVDAAMMNAPFLQEALADGAVLVTDFLDDAGVGAIILVTFAGGNFVDENPDLMDRLLQAWDEALKYGEANEEELRLELQDYLGMTAELAAETSFPGFSAEIDKSALQKYAEMMVEYGIVDGLPDVDQVLRK